MVRAFQSPALEKATPRILIKTRDIEHNQILAIYDFFTSNLYLSLIFLCGFEFGAISGNGRNPINYSKAESEPVIKGTRSKVDKDRKHKIVAAIVRIM